ncbi:hypothetical protein, partial [Streptomyces anulatus]|uniref:hypothetical protein n=1 Tax=Streptomyces anulatus TaxID=1892 RepID=UPI00369A4FB9
MRALGGGCLCHHVEDHIDELVGITTAPIRSLDEHWRATSAVRAQHKNIALHLYAAALLTDVPVVLTEAPDIVDTGVCAQILCHT